jgi:K(+)-stimulated pyrophosphate-energized sodium pump
MTALYIPFIIAILSLCYAGYNTFRVLSHDNGTDKMREIAHAIQDGSMAYMHRQFKTVAIFAVIIAVLMAYLLDWHVALAFVVGSVFSGLAGYIGMNVSVRANVRTAAAAKKGLSEALDVAFRGGSVTGLAVVGLSLLGVTGLYIAFKTMGLEESEIPHLLIGFGFGASLISLFARLGGGIFTKAADVGADLVGKVEAGIPEDDPRNPATIADNVGDNVGDCAGMGADLFETYAVTVVAAMVLAVAEGFGGSYVLYPVALGAVAILASIVGFNFIKTKSKTKIMAALYKGMAVTMVLAMAGFYLVTKWMIPDSGSPMSLYWTAVVGAVLTILIIIITFTLHNPLDLLKLSSHFGDNRMSCFTNRTHSQRRESIRNQSTQEQPHQNTVIRDIEDQILSSSQKSSVVILEKNQRSQGSRTNRISFSNRLSRVTNRIKRIGNITNILRKT